MTMQIRKAVRSQAKLRLGIAGPSGSGKTYSALQLGLGFEVKVGLIDTEHGSGELYAHLGDYDVIRIDAPYTVQKYLEALHAFEEAGYGVVIIDSLSHAWAGDGGLLDKQGKIADQSGNSYTAWRKVTPEHNQLVEAMLASPCHLVATVRSKQEYSQEKDDKGKTVVKKLGMAPVQREGMEYEFTVFLDLSMDHTATASKDRTSLFDGQYFKIDNRVSKRLLQWLNTGEAPVDRAGEAMAALEELEKNVAALEVSFTKCETMPDLAAMFDAGLKAVQGYKDAVGKEATVPFVNRVVAAKDARKAALTKPAADQDDDQLAGLDMVTPDDVTRLEQIATGYGFNLTQAYEILGVKRLGDIARSGYALAVEKLHAAGKAKAPAKPARRRAAAAGAQA